MIFINVAVFTVKIAVLLVMPPKTAVMFVDVPPIWPVAKPDVGSTEALAGVFELQAEDAVTSMDVPSVYIAVAVNCRMPSTGTEYVKGVTCMDVNERAGNQCPVSPLLP